MGGRRKKGESEKSLPFYRCISVPLENFSKVHMSVDVSNYMGNIHNCIYKIHCNTALAGIAQWIEHGLQTKRLLVQFPVRAHAWVAGQVPSGGHMRGNHTLIFLSLSPSLPLSLKINK